MEHKSQANRRMTGWQKFFYGCGEGASTFATTAVGMFYLFFLTDIVGLRPSLAGAVVFMGNMWDAITDPFVGWLSDRSENRFGRRRVWILGSTLPFAISFALIWYVPSGLGQIATFAYCTMVFMLYIFMITSYMVPYTTLAMELTDDYDERNQLAMWRMVFSIGLALPATVLPKLLIDAMPEPRNGYFAMGWILGLFMVPLAALVVFAGKERKSRSDGIPFFVSFKNALSFKPFRQAIYMYVCSMLPLRLLMATILYYFTYYLRLQPSFELAMGLMMISSVVCLFMWDALARRLDKRRAYIIGISVAAALVMVFILPPGVIAKLLIPVAVLMGLGVSAMHIMPIAIVPEVIDAGRAQGFDASEGVWNGVITFMHKMSAALAALAMGGLLDLAGYVAGVEQQKSSAIFAIVLLVSIAPALIMFIGVMVAITFKIGRKEAALLKEASKK